MFFSVVHYFIDDRKITSFRGIFLDTPLDSLDYRYLNLLKVIAFFYSRKPNWKKHNNANIRRMLSTYVGALIVTGAFTLMPLSVRRQSKMDRSPSDLRDTSAHLV
jgi:uncharacterized membrane protein